MHVGNGQSTACEIRALVHAERSVDGGAEGVGWGRRRRCVLFRVRAHLERENVGLHSTGRGDRD